MLNFVIFISIIILKEKYSALFVNVLVFSGKVNVCHSTWVIFIVLKNLLVFASVWK